MLLRLKARKAGQFVSSRSVAFLLMTPMCAVACWNVAVQEDKALFGRISRCVPWKHVEAAVSFCVSGRG